MAAPTMEVRLVTRPRRGIRLDLLFSRPEHGLFTAIEVKYLTARLNSTVAGEEFNLPNHGAQDVRGYDVISDIARVEAFTADKQGWNGFVIALTNDGSYWRAPLHSRPTNAAAFRLYDGVRLGGTRSWGPNTGAGTMKGRMQAVGLIGAYELFWRDYSRVPSPNGQFRVLVVEI